MAKRTAIAGGFDDEEENEIIDAGQRMPADLMVLKMENEQIFALARTRGRDYEKIKKDLVAGLESFPEAAVDSIYAKPVGFKKDVCSKCEADIGRARGDQPPEACPNPKCKGAKVIIGGQQYARNLSIRAAETLASAFGFCRTSTMLSDYGEEKIKITATFTDYTSCRVHIADSICSPYYKSRSGGMQKMPDDRFLELKVKAESSKAIREATLRCIPHPLRIWYMTECEKVASRLLTKEKVAEIVQTFDKFGVSEVDLGLLLGKALKMGLTEEDRKVLLGLFTQIKESPEDFWPGLNRLRDEVLSKQPEIDLDTPAGPPGTKEAAAARGVVTGSDLMKDKKKTESPVTVTEEKASGEVIPEVSRADIAKATAKAPVAAPIVAASPPASSTAPTAPSPPKGPQSLQGVVNFIIQMGYEASDFDPPKIFEGLKGVQNWVKVLEAILTRRHPNYADYLANPMESPEAEQESPDAPQEGQEEPLEERTRPASEQATLLPKEDAWDTAERKYKEFMEKIAAYKQTARIQTVLEWALAEKLLSDAQKKAIADAAKARCREIEDAK